MLLHGTRNWERRVACAALLVAVFLNLGIAQDVASETQFSDLSDGTELQISLDTELDFCNPDAVPCVIVCSSREFTHWTLNTNQRTDLVPSTNAVGYKTDPASSGSSTTYCSSLCGCRMWSLKQGQPCLYPGPFSVVLYYAEPASTANPIHGFVSYTVTRKDESTRDPLGVLEAVSYRKENGCKLLPKLSQQGLKETRVNATPNTVPFCSDSLDDEEWTHTVFERVDLPDVPVVSDWTRRLTHLTSKHDAIVNCNPSSIPPEKIDKGDYYTYRHSATPKSGVFFHGNKPAQLTFDLGYRGFCNVNHWCLAACTSKRIGVSKIELIFPGSDKPIFLESSIDELQDKGDALICRTACSCSIWDAMAKAGPIGCDTSRLTLAVTPEHPGFSAPFVGFMTSSGTLNAQSQVRSPQLFQPLALPAVFPCKSIGDESDPAYTVSYVKQDSKRKLPVCEKTAPTESLHEYLQVWTPHKIRSKLTDVNNIGAWEAVLQRRPVALTCKLSTNKAFISYGSTFLPSYPSVKPISIPVKGSVEWWNPCDVLQPTCITLCYDKEVTVIDTELLLPGRRFVPLKLRPLGETTTSSSFTCSAICGCDLFAAVASAPQKVVCKSHQIADSLSIRVAFAAPAAQIFATAYISSFGFEASVRSSPIAIPTAVTALTQDLDSTGCVFEMKAEPHSSVHHTLHYVKKSPELMRGTTIPSCDAEMHPTDNKSDYWVVWSLRNTSWTVTEPVDILPLFGEKTLLLPSSSCKSTILPPTPASRPLVPPSSKPPASLIPRPMLRVNDNLSVSNKLLFYAPKAASVNPTKSIYMLTRPEELPSKSLCTFHHPYVVTACLKEYTKPKAVSVRLHEDLPALKLAPTPLTRSDDRCYTVDACAVWDVFFDNKRPCNITSPSLEVEYEKGDTHPSVPLNLVISGVPIPTATDEKTFNPHVAHDSNSAIWIPPKYTCRATSGRGKLWTLVSGSNGSQPHCVATKPELQEHILGSVYLIDGHFPAAKDFVVDQTVASTTLNCSTSAVKPLLNMTSKIVFLLALTMTSRLNSNPSKNRIIFI